MSWKNLKIVVNIVMKAIKLRKFILTPIYMYFYR